MSVRTTVKVKLEIRFTTFKFLGCAGCNALAEIQMMWERTERFVGAMEPRDGQQELKAGAQTLRIGMAGPLR